MTLSDPAGQDQIYNLQRLRACNLFDNTPQPCCHLLAAAQPQSAMANSLQSPANSTQTPHSPACALR